jgi:hypothetical protein
VRDVLRILEAAYPVDDDEVADFSLVAFVGSDVYGERKQKRGPAGRIGKIASASNSPHGRPSMKSLNRTLASAIALTSTLAAGGSCTVNTTTANGDGGGSDAAVQGMDSAADLDGATQGGGDAGTDAATEAATTGDGGGLLGFAPSNLGDALNAIDVSKLTDIDVATSDDPSVACAANGCVALHVTESGGSTIVVYVAKSWKIEPAGALGVRDHTPVVIVATTTIDILGKLDASGQGFTAVGGGHSGGNATVGMGPGGGGIGSSSSPGPGVGAGGGGYCGAGGVGGGASATMGMAGPSSGTATLVPLLGGSAGGGAELFGGAGGGAIELVAGSSITVEAGGVVSAGGGGGSSGGRWANGQAASGGGSGGAVLFEAPRVTVAGTVAVNGGGGGGGGTPEASGSDATANATPAGGGNVGMTGAGGNGSAAATTAGAAGSAGDTNNVGGGGGGGAGYIRINTQSGAATLSGTLSPSAGSACSVQGTLAH